MRISKLVSALLAATFLIATATARADVAPLPTGGHSGTGGSSAAGGGASSITAGASSTTAGSNGDAASAPKEDDGGCSIGNSHRASGIAFGVLGVALAFGLRRVRSRN